MSATSPASAPDLARDPGPSGGTAPTRPRGFAADVSWKSLAGLTAGLLTAIRRGRTRNEVYRALDRLPDHLLADIGIERGGLPAYADEVARGAERRRAGNFTA